jgi:hypothetical protein
VSLVTALITVLVIKLVNLPSLIVNIVCGVSAGIVVIYLCSTFIKGKIIGHICNIKIGKIDVRGSELYVDDIFVSNYLGADRGRDLFMTEGIAVVLEPKYPASRITLENYGQRQAILFEAVRALGVKRYQFMRRNFPTGRVVIALVPIINDPDLLIKVVSNTPILENSRKISKADDTYRKELVCQIFLYISPLTINGFSCDPLTILEKDIDKTKRINT